MAGTITKPVAWVGSSYKDFRAFPGSVQDATVYALYWAQTGDLHESAEPMKGFGGASVVEIVEDYGTDTYRAVYTVRFTGTSTFFMPCRRRREEAGRHLIKRLISSGAGCGRPRGTIGGMAGGSGP